MNDEERLVRLEKLFLSLSIRVEELETEASPMSMVAEVPSLEQMHRGFVARLREE